MDLDSRYFPNNPTQQRINVEQEILSLANPNVGLHGTSDYRDGLIELSRSYDPTQSPEGDDPRFTYYTLIDPTLMKKYKVHPLFFSYTLASARGFARRAVKRDQERGIASKPVLRVMTNMRPETISYDCKALEPSGPTLFDIECKENHHGLYERTIGKIEEVDYDIDENVVENDTRVLQKLIPILLRPQSPVKGYE